MCSTKLILFHPLVKIALQKKKNKIKKEWWKKRKKVQKKYKKQRMPKLNPYAMHIQREYKINGQILSCFSYIF